MCIVYYLRHTSVHKMRTVSRVLWEAVLNAINSGSPRNADTSHPTQRATQNQAKQLLSKRQYYMHCAWLGYTSQEGKPH